MFMDWHSIGYDSTYATKNKFYTLNTLFIKIPATSFRELLKPTLKFIEKHQKLQIHNSRNSNYRSITIPGLKLYYGAIVIKIS